jgi:hypothetical protein
MYVCTYKCIYMYIILKDVVEIKGELKAKVNIYMYIDI